MEDSIPESAGRSSFNLLQEDLFFETLRIEPGTTVLDLACGLGNYSIAAASYVGQKGIIHAFDLWEEGIEILETRASIAGFTNIRAEVADVSQGIPVEDHSVDLCLLATFIHILIDENKVEDTLKEIKRVVKPHGSIAIVEFKKIEGPPGPPLSMRHSPHELETILAPHNLYMKKSIEIGPYNYLAIFTGEKKL